MGTRVAPNFANTHVGKFEDDHVYTYHLQPFIYLRYLDDIVLVWQHGLGTEQICRPPQLHIDCDLHQVSREEISFLDTTVTVKLRDRSLHTNLFCSQLTHIVTYYTVQLTPSSPPLSLQENHPV